jgi:hypothetical protein
VFHKSELSLLDVPQPPVDPNKAVDEQGSALMVPWKQSIAV